MYTQIFWFASWVIWQEKGKAVLNRIQNFKKNNAGRILENSIDSPSIQQPLEGLDWGSKQSKSDPRPGKGAMPNQPVLHSDLFLGVFPELPYYYNFCFSPSFYF